MDGRPSKRQCRLIESDAPGGVGESRSKANQKKETTKSKSLHSFFQPASEAQRWSSQKFEVKRTADLVPEETVDADAIEDDYDSYDDIFTQHLNGPSTRADHSQTRKRTTTHSSKRFLMPASSSASTTKRNSPVHPLAELDSRPWAQRFAPSNLGELAVHKKKVSDVRNWLEEAFAGRNNQVSTLLSARRDR